MNTSVPTTWPPCARPASRLALGCLLTLLCAAPADAELIGFAALNAGLSRAAADLVADKAACEQFAGTPRDVCREQARAKEMVTRAELGLASTGTRKSQDYLAAVKLDTAYDIARTQCNDKTGDAKTLCTKQAHATRAKGQAELKLHQRMPDGQPGAEKCDAVAAEARAACTAAAKATQAKAGKKT